MKIGFVMDPVESMKIEKDTSYSLMRASFELGWDVYHFLLPELSLYGADVKASGRKMLRLPENEPPELEAVAEFSLSELDALWIRKDPPFDRRYFYSTLFVDFLKSDVFVINDPASLRNFNEKLGALYFSEYTPKTLISSQPDQIKEFVGECEKAVLKPLDGFGGKGIEFVSRADADLDSKIAEITHQGSHWVVANDFVRDSHLGDKRILLVEGEPIGAILRKSDSGGLHNMDQGGRAHPCELSDLDLEVCRKLKPWFIENKMFFVGIDMLGSALTEVNVTSPTGLQELSRFAGKDFPMQIMSRVGEICAQSEHPFR